MISPNQMKRLFALTLMLSISITAFSQKREYAQNNNIQYYADSAASDAYKKEKCVLDIYYPKNTKNFATIVWFHGGGLTGGSKEIPEDLKNSGIAVIGVGYRLSPKVKSPAFIEDAAAALAWAFRHIENFGGDPSKIFVSGLSAGGYLANMLALDKKWMAKYDIDANDLAGLISVTGQAITHFTIREEKNIAPTQAVIDEFAPISYVRNDAPPILLITGDRELELFGRYEENAYFMRMLKLVGHKDAKLLEIQGYGHNVGKPAFPLVLQEIERVTKAKLSSTK